MLLNERTAKGLYEKWIDTLEVRRMRREREIILNMRCICTLLHVLYEIFLIIINFFLIFRLKILNIVTHKVRK